MFSPSSGRGGQGEGRGWGDGGTAGAARLCQPDHKKLRKHSSVWVSVHVWMERQLSGWVKRQDRGDPGSPCPRQHTAAGQPSEPHELPLLSWPPHATDYQDRGGGEGGTFAATPPWAGGPLPWPRASGSLS